jgi:hypothetical protein
LESKEHKKNKNDHNKKKVFFVSRKETKNISDNKPKKTINRSQIAENINTVSA